MGIYEKIWQQIAVAEKFSLGISRAAGAQTRLVAAMDARITVEQFLGLKNRRRTHHPQRRRTGTRMPSGRSSYPRTC